MNQPDAEVDAFLSRYAATLTDFDSQAAASLWSTPGMIHALDRQLTDSTAFYIVRRDHGGLQTCVCVQVDDAEKINALATERGVDLSDISE